MAIFQAVNLTNMLEFPPPLGAITERSDDRVVLLVSGPVEYRTVFTGSFQFGEQPGDGVPGELPDGFDPSVFDPGSFDPNDLLPDDIQDVLDDLEGLLPDTPDFDAFSEIYGTVTGIEHSIGGEVSWRASELDIPIGNGENEGTLINMLSLFLLGLDGPDQITGSDFDDLLQGYGGNDTIDGGLGIDFITGMGGDDTVRTGSLGDTVNGNEGYDTVIVPGAIDAFRVGFAENAATLINKITGEPETTLYDVEKLIFDDGEIELAIFDGIAEISADDIDRLIEMYVAYFDRAPDSEGLFYWGTRLADGMTLSEIAASFFTQNETRDAFPNPDDFATLVDAVYNNLLERDADALGRDYWINQLETGASSRSQFILDVINGSRGAEGDPGDVATLTQKADIGLYYAGIKGLSDVDNAIAAMDLYVRENATESLRAARDLIDDFAEAVDSPEGGTGLTTPLLGVVIDPFLSL